MLSLLIAVLCVPAEGTTQTFQTATHGLSLVDDMDVALPVTREYVAQYADSGP